MHRMLSSCSLRRYNHPLPPINLLNFFSSFFLMYIYISKPFRVEILIPLNIPRVVVNWYLNFSRPTVLERTIFSRSSFILQHFFFFARKEDREGRKGCGKTCENIAPDVQKKDDYYNVQSYYKLFVLRMQLQHNFNILYHVHINTRYREWRFHDITSIPRIYCLAHRYIAKGQRANWYHVSQYIFTSDSAIIIVGELLRGNVRCRPVDRCSACALDRWKRTSCETTSREYDRLRNTAIPDNPKWRC